MPLVRPPSLSDSFVYYNFELTSTDDLRTRSPVFERPVSQEFSIQKIKPEREGKNWKILLLRYSIRFSFHILLIGLFETIFFFYFVSNQENNGLLKDVNVFLDQITTPCRNLTLAQKEVLDEILFSIVNLTEIKHSAAVRSEDRASTNHILYVQAWVYECIVFIIFISFTVLSFWKKIKINWKRLILENIALLFFLGMYEYAFFSTIVFNYMPISTDELEASALSRIKDEC